MRYSGPMSPPSFDRYADGRTISPRRLQKAEILAGALDRLLPAREGVEIVDFGCADGAVPVSLLRRTAEARVRRITGITLLDYNDLAEKPAHTHPRFRRLVGDLSGELTGLDLPWGACDMVTATAFLHYLPDPAVAFRHAHRLLVPGGYLLAGHPARALLALRACGIPGLLPRNRRIRHLHTLAAWREIAGACGFTEVSRQAVQWAGTRWSAGLERWLRAHHWLAGVGSNYLVVYQKAE
jgi:SAM-dependent methyltransferase